MNRPDILVGPETPGKLQRRRVQLGKTQRQVGVAQGVISKIEAGLRLPTAETLVLIAMHLETTALALSGDPHRLCPFCKRDDHKED